MEDEYSGMRENKRSWRTILLPLMGFLLLGSSAVIAFVLAPEATRFLRQNINGLPGDEGIVYVVGVGIFLILLMIFAMLYAVAAPKPDKIVSEQELEREKKAREREKAENRKRRRAINREMARRNRENDNG